jgi:LmbE family N-acetylglucosaminyl deacetylase
LKVSKILGITEVMQYTFPRDGYLENHKQEIRDILWKLRELWKPDIVLCPTIHDFHQDHKAVAECCFTIFRDTSTILSYEVLRSSTPEFKPNYYMILQLCDATKKFDALNLYKSQIKGRPYFFNKEKYSAHMKMRGTQVKAKWAEAFELVWGRVD